MNLRDQLLGIRSQHGYLTPEIVKEAARPELVLSDLGSGAA